MFDHSPPPRDLFHYPNWCEITLTNPYSPSSSEVEQSDGRRYVHPDWKWMAAITFVICCFALLLVAGVFKSTSTRPSLIKLRFAPSGFAASYRTFLLLVPVLSSIPTIAVSSAFRFYYTRISPTTRTTEWNSLFLICGIFASVILAICFQQVYV